MWPGEVFYLPDPCELTFANTLLLSNAAISLGNAFINLEISSQFYIFFTLISFSLSSLFLTFWNYNFILFNGNSIYGLCFTFWTNEFLGSYSYYKFIITISIINRIHLWRTLYLQSNIEEIFYLSFRIPISSLWFSGFTYF